MQGSRQEISADRIRVDLSRGGWRKFRQLNERLGAGYIRGFILRHELSVYIEQQEASGTEFDTQCQELRYDDGICVIIRKLQGLWYIVDIWMTEAAEGFIPLFIWKRVMNGCKQMLIRILGGWQAKRFPFGWRSFNAQECS